MISKSQAIARFLRMQSARHRCRQLYLARPRFKMSRIEYWSVFDSDVVQAFRPANTADLKVRTTPKSKTV